MIQMPRRSVTRFFIPLIDVLTLLFCIYLLMPIVKPAGAEETGDAVPSPAEAKLSAEERQELERLRKLDEARRRSEAERLRRQFDPAPPVLVPPATPESRPAAPG